MKYNTTQQIHLAGTYTGGLRRAAAWDSIEPWEAEILTGYPYLLESYHYLGKSERYRKEIATDNRKVFLDSGAFSMFTQGIEVNMDAYVNYIKKNQDIIEVASVLDGIGDPQKTYENQCRLEGMGVNVLPCFHYGEDTRYLEYYLANYEHITLGGMVPISTPELYKWLDYIWGNFLTDSQGCPTHKVHGFGLTVLGLMLRYPWYSVDSTSWVLTGRFGSIYMAREDGTEYKLAISDQSPKLKDINAHYDSLSPFDQRYVNSVFEENGFKAEELRSMYWKRDVWNILYFRKLCERAIQPFINPEQGLFDAF